MQFEVVLQVLTPVAALVRQMIHIVVVQPYGLHLGECQGFLAPLVDTRAVGVGHIIQHLAVGHHRPILRLVEKVALTAHPHGGLASAPACYGIGTARDEKQAVKFL